MIYTFICRRCDDLPVAACCRVMGVSPSGFYAWRARPVSDRDWDDAVLTNTIVDIHRASRCSYGSPRVHADLRLDQDLRCSRKRVERLMRQANIRGIYRRKGRGCTRRDPAAESSDDLVRRAFDPTEPDRLWMMDVTEHPTTQGKVYLAVVLDAFSRRIVGWSIADHIRAELVIDALQMAAWRRRPPEGQTVAHSDHGSQGGLNRSSQHLEHGGADGDDAGAAAGGPVVSRSGALAGAADGGMAGGSGQVLDGYRRRDDDRGCSGRGGGVIAGCVPVVPPRWRREPVSGLEGVGAVSVLR